jgi:membrane protease YdiL (CAAX protease family)
VAVLWALTIVALAALPPGDLLVAPVLPGFFSRLGAAHRIVVPVAAALLAGLVVPVIIAYVSPQGRARMTKPLETLAWYLPSSPAERRWFVAVAVSAGVCEEVLYRGFLLRYLTAHAPALGGTGAVLVAALMFAVAHTYQGVTGVVATGLMALGFTALFVASGSLWLPMLMHVLVDLRVLLLWRGHAPNEDEHTGAV